MTKITYPYRDGNAAAAYAQAQGQAAQSAAAGASSALKGLSAHVDADGYIQLIVDYPAGPTSPVNLVVLSEALNTTTLQWVNTATAANVDYIGIQRSRDGGATWNDLVQNLPHFTTQYTDTLSADYDQSYRVWCEKNSVRHYSNVVTTTSRALPSWISGLYLFNSNYVDSSGNGNNLSALGTGTTVGSTGVTLDGNGYLSAGDKFKTDQTVGAYMLVVFKPVNSPTPVSAQWVVSKQLSGAGEYAISINTSGVVSGAQNGSGVGVNGINTLDGGWHYAEIRVTPTTLYTYADSVMASVTRTLPAQGTRNWTLGGDSAGNLKLKGQILHAIAVIGRDPTDNERRAIRGALRRDAATRGITLPNI